MIASLLMMLALQAPVPDTLSQDVLGRTAARMSERQVAGGQDASSAAFLMGPSGSYTEAGIGLEGRRERKPVWVEDGATQGEAVAGVRTLVRLDSLQAVRGEVEYRRGHKGGVLWNSGSDFRTVYPYIVADTVGGRVSREQYAFSGGYARRMGNVYAGVEGAYRALQEYRSVDPRPRSIVSDLRVALAAGYALPAGYAVDVTAAYRRYSQSETIDFYSRRGNNSAVFHLTGLGGDFYRFAGASDAYLTTRYAGNGVDVLLSLIPEAGRSGLKAAAGYQRMDVIHYLPYQNEAPYTESISRTGSLEAGWLGERWALSVRGRMEAREGIESVIDNGAAGRFLELLRFSMYRGRWYEGGLEGIWEPASWSFTASVFWRGQDESYVYPIRKMSLSQLVVSLGGAFRRRLSREWLAAAGLRAGCGINLTDALTLPVAETQPKALTHIRSRYDGLCADVLTAAAHLRADRRIREDFSLFVSLEGRLLTTTADNRAGFGTLTIGCNF